MQHSLWLYYRIYDETGPVGIEHLLTRTIPHVLTSYAFTRWFFIRYLDEKGLHIRLRLKVSKSELLQQASNTVTPILKESLMELCKETKECQLLEDSRKRTARSWSGVAASRSIEMDEYKPEVESFGAKGVAVAEKVFQVSSEVAVRILQNERQGQCSRVTVVPILMRDVAEAFVRQELPKVFWNRYAAYWLNNGESIDAAQWKLKFLSKAEEAKVRGVAIPAPDSQLPGGLRDCLAPWRAALSEAALAYVTLDEEQAQRPSYLAFQFIHLMNNRLGILPLSESYFATMLACQQTGRAS